MTITEKVLKSDKRAVSRAITLIENNNSNSREIINSLSPHTGKALRIGITGPPGAGKSTLTNELAKHYSKLNKKVGIIAVDPTSPFSGGALLGDRVRMNDVSLNNNVLIRSMATRGSLGGLALKSVDTADILDAAGYDIIIFETVGVGQSELDVLNATDVVLVVLVPESGDSIQAMKAGLMEIADIFILNKSDRPGADSAYNSLKNILALKHHDESTFMIPVIKAIAVASKGIDEISDKVNEFTDFQKSENHFKNRRKKNLEFRVKSIVEKDLSSYLWDNANILNSLESEINSPYLMAENIKSKLSESLKPK